MMKLNNNTMRYLHHNKQKIEANNRDSAIIPKAVESIARDLALHGRIRKGDWKPRHMDKKDITFYTIDEQGHKKLVRLEVKCNCGSLYYAESDGMGDYIDFPESLEDVTDDMLVHDADFVVFFLEADARVLEKPEIVLEACVLPRADYIRLLYAMGNGKPHIKLNKSRGQVNIQTMVSYSKKTDKWSDKPLQRGYDFIDECPIIESYEEFLRRFGRI